MKGRQASGRTACSLLVLSEWCLVIMVKGPCINQMTASSEPYARNQIKALAFWSCSLIRGFKCARGSQELLLVRRHVQVTFFSLSDGNGWRGPIVITEGPANCPARVLAFDLCSAFVSERKGSNNDKCLPGAYRMPTPVPCVCVRSKYFSQCCGKIPEKRASKEEVFILELQGIHTMVT